MVVIDATILLLLIRPGTSVPAGPDGSPIDRPKERIELLIAQLQKTGEKVVIPAPALSEALVRAGAEETSRIVELLNRHSVFRIEPFDTRSAIEVAAMTRRALDGKGGKKDGSNSTWAKVKFDRQIVAIAKVCGASKIYSDDEDVQKLAKQHNLSVAGLAELPLPESDRQFKLNLEGHADGQEQLAAPPEVSQQAESGTPSDG